MISPHPSLESFAVSLPPNETERLLHELQKTNKELLDKIQRLEESQPLWKSIYVSIKGFLRRHSRRLLAMPNLLATFSWLSMLVYYTCWYLTLARDEKGRHPQICQSFSLWPYISCIGEKKPTVFRVVCITMAILISTSFLLLCRLGSPIAPGLWLRRAAAFFAIVSSCALVTLSFFAVDEAPTAHLAATSVQIFAMGNTKFFDWMANSVIRRGFKGKIGAGRRVRPLEVARWLKTCVAAFAAVPAMVTCMGVYNCTDIKDINDPTSTCNKVVALSAVAEWLLSIGWVAYVSTIAYDLYHISVVVDIWQLTDGSIDSRGCDLESWKDQQSEETLQVLLPHTPCCSRESLPKKGQTISIVEFSPPTP